MAIKFSTHYENANLFSLNSRCKQLNMKKTNKKFITNNYFNTLKKTADF